MKAHSGQPRRATAASVALHLVIVAAFSVDVRFPSPERMPAQAVAIEAMLVDEGLVQREIERIDAMALADASRREEAERQALEAVETARLEREREEQRLDTLREQTEAVERAEAERQAAVQIQREQDAEEQRQREAALERERVAEEARQAEEQERLALERAAEEERQREEQERLEQERAAEAERQRVQAEAAAAERARLEEELFAAIAQEEEVRRARDSGLEDEYLRSIQNRIQQRWIRPPSAREGLECVINVTQIPSGEVTSAVVGQCNGDDAVKRSIETAVLRASPLPRPPIPALFDRSLVITFTPDD